MAWEISVRERIDAPPSTVWEVLTDLDAYSEWNPTLTRVRGDPELGERLRGSLALPSGLRVPFTATVTVYDPQAEFRWETGLPSVGGIDAEHAAFVTPAGDGVEFEQRERFEGALAEPLLSRLSADLRAGFEEMADALRERAESRATV